MAITVISALSFSCSDNVSIWLIGDSTMAWKSPDKVPETGWGMVLHEFCREGIQVKNHALNGRSSKSFLMEGRWDPIYDSLKKGDYVIIQFGHNDQKPDTARFTDPNTTYREYLKRYIDDTRSKGATPLICSSIVRRHFDGAGNLKDTHGDYIKAAAEIAAETGTAFVDMEALTRKLVTEAGPEESKSFFLFCGPGEYTNRPDGIQDSTHLNLHGARKIAELFAMSVSEQKLPLAGLLK